MQALKKLFMFTGLALSCGALANTYSLNSEATVTTTAHWPETHAILDIISGSKPANASEFGTALESLTAKKASDPIGFSNNELQCLKQGKSPARGLIVGTVGDFPSVQQVLTKFGATAETTFIQLITQ